MRERPILFNSPMVRAILSGAKTQTRRVVKPQPVDQHGGDIQWHVGGLRAWVKRACPYGQPGDRLWVRETWRDWSSAAWHYAADGLVLPKQRDRDLAVFLSQRAPFTWESYTWRPSIHMPRAASRITLEVADVRVERLQSISDADAEAEGAEPRQPLKASGIVIPGQYRHGFRDLWESINGPGSWDANPWVWCVSFRRAA